MLGSPNGSNDWRRKVLLTLLICDSQAGQSAAQFRRAVELAGTALRFVRPTQNYNLKAISQMLRFSTSFATLLILTSTVIAHEGHGHPEHQQGAAHYLVNPSHALPVLLSVAAIAGIGFLISRSVKKWRS
jgi:hypothetical protein